MRFLPRLNSLILSATIITGSALAGPQDVAPISNEIIQKLVRDPITRANNPAPDMLSKSLDEAVDLARGVEADEAEEAKNAGSRAQAIAAKRSLFAAKRHEVNNLKSEFLRQFAEMRAKLVALNVPDKLAAWDQKTQRVKARFARLDAAFGALDTAHPGDRAKALAQLKGELHVLHEQPKAKREVPDANPQPTGRLAPEAGAPTETPSAAVPAYLSYRRPADNMYAFLGNTLLAAAPPTPPEALSCNYTQADRDPTTDVVIDSEIQTLAQQLNYSPAKIYQWVHDSIAFDPYYGSLKGSKGTLVSGRGNATDQTSLLIALLRASNIPARYVRGTTQFTNDTRVQRWLGVKTYQAAAAVLSRGGIPAAYQVSGPNQYVLFNHVWVEACVPYGRYRGANIDNSGTRWIPLDAAFKDKTYPSNIPVSVAFDYSTAAGKYLATRTDQLPHERYADDVQTQLRQSNPNATVQDVPYKGSVKPLKVDVLPASLPYQVNTFLNWSGTTSPEIASLPDTHRYKFTVTVKNGSAVLLTTQVAYPDAALKRLTLSFAPSDAASQTLWNSWGGDLASLPAGSVNVAPVLKLDGVQVGSATGSAVLGQPAKLTLIMKLTRGDESIPPWCVNDSGNSTDPVDSAPTCLNKTVYTNITTGGYHALTAYAFQASNRHLTDRAAALLAATRTYPAPTPVNAAAYDATVGEYLNLVLMKYARYVEDSSRQVGELQGMSALRGNDIGLTSSDMKVSYVLDEPYAVDIGAPYIDVKGGLSRITKIDSTTTDATAQRNEIWPSFKLGMYAASALEHYVWQENARTDAVSTVRGLQYAAENAIPVYTFTSANIAQWDSLMDASMAPYKVQIQNEVASGASVTIPRQTISYTGPGQPKAWVGAVYMAENQTLGSMGAIIAGGLAGGYPLVYPPPLNGGIYFLDAYVPPAITPIYENISSFFNSQTASNGACVFCTFSNDPVNMLTGNLYHNERDVSVPGRGGLPLVFERAYNSRKPADGPLGYGWTHSFNHYLRFYGVDGTQAKISWTDGSGAEKFFATASHASGNINANTTLNNPSGIFVTVKRETNGTYTVTEKNGLQYSFESINATSTDTAQRAKLLEIRDRNNNALTLAYNPDATLKEVSDGLGRKFAFTYASGRIAQLDFKDAGGTILRSQTYGYDTNGDLTSFKNPLALANPSTQPPLTYTYYTATDGQNLAHAMKSYVLPRGNGMNFEYYANGKVFRHTTTLGEVTTFTYNDFRREAIATNARGFERRFFFDQNGNQAKLIEENGAERIYTYDPTNPFNRLSKKDPRGYLSQYTYDALGNVTQVTQPDGSTIGYFDFNSFNQPQRVKDARGNWTVLQYDAKGNLTNQIRLKAGITPVIPYTPAVAQIAAWSVLGYNAYGNQTSTRQVRDIAVQIANPASISGPTLEYALDANSLYPIQVTRKGDKTGDGVADAPDSASLVYDTQGRQTQGIDGDWQLRSTGYDLADRVIQATDALGKQRQFGYDANGNLVSVQLVDNNELVDSSIQEYDLSDRKYRAIDAGGHALTTEFDPVGNPVKITDADGYSLGFIYDAADRALQAEDKEGNTVSTSRDIDGQPRSVTDPNNNSSTYTYWDATRNGRLKQSIDAATRATTFDYDANGNVISVTDNLNRVTLSQYDEMNRPVRVVGPTYTDATLGSIRPVTTFQYDSLSNRTQVKAGYTTDTTGQGTAADVLATQLTAVLDDFGRKLKETDALNKFATWQYDLNNNVTFATDAKNQVTQFTWDTGHQIKTLKDHNNNLYSYTRNALGQITQVVSPAVTYSYQYDAAHRLTQVSDSRANKTLAYAWSPGGLLNSMVDSDANRTDYLYDAVGRLTGIWAPNYDYVAFGYDKGGRLIEKWYPNGVDSQLSWNADNTLNSLTNKVGSTTLSSHVYGYDGVGNRSTQAETVNGSTISYSYQYDALNRLTQVQNGTATQQENYAYDSLGNRTAKTVNATTPSVIAYVYDAANQLKEIRQTNAGGALLIAMIYDLNGSLTQKCEGSSVTTNGASCSGTIISNLTYDALSRTVQAAKTGQPTQTYAYDDSGRRISKALGSTTTKFLYGGPDIVAEYPSTWGTPTAQYTHGPNQDEPLARITSTGAQYFHHDGLGSVVALTNNFGTTDATQKFDAWGNQIAATGTQSRYGFTGREPDETGLVFYRARYLDPTIGRFTQRDPAGMADGVNRYVYVGNDPVNLIDPTGEYAEVLVKGNRVTVTVPIEYRGPGATPAVIQKFNQGIADNWAGQFGKYDVKVNVVSPPTGTPADKKNIIDVPAGDGRAFVNGVGGNTGVWPAKRPAWTAAHEAGHLMGLKDKYTDTGGANKGWGGNIMATHDGRPDARNIQEIIKANPAPTSPTRQNLKEVAEGNVPTYDYSNFASNVRSKK